ncbi:MAG: hypothetical protein JW882_21035, partial [Deltaproteobacteria bacterium]|nr:hypothetical protein [Deltaproteobacteria bacterium]
GLFSASPPYHLSSWNGTYILRTLGEPHEAWRHEIPSSFVPVLSRPVSLDGGDYRRMRYLGGEAEKRPPCPAGLNDNCNFLTGH